MSVLLASTALFTVHTEARAQASGGNVADAIVVTAQRRSERLQDVPITITSINSDQLIQAGSRTISDIAKLTPALRFDATGEFVQPTIRGVGTSVTQSGSGGNVGIYVDGFYAPNPSAADFQLLNVESVQVLKGPQGTLFGRNTTGGAILVTTRKPSTDSGGMIEASYGSYDARQLQGYFTTGLSKNIAFDLAGMIGKGDGYFKNIFTGSKRDGRYDDWSIRAGLEVSFSDRFSALLRYTHQKVDNPATTVPNAYVQNGLPLVLGAYIPGTVVATKPGEVSNSERLHLLANNDIYQLTLTYDMEFATLTSYTQRREEYSSTFLSLGAVSRSLVYVNNITPNKTTTQEILLSSKPGGRLQWTAGGFYFWNDDPIAVNVSVFGSPLTSQGLSRAYVRSFAAFADATYQATDRLFLTLGLRYSIDNEHDSYWDHPNSGFVELPDLKTRRLTPRAVVRYAFDNNTSAYASFTRGYKAAIYNLGGESRIPVRPEGINAYEVGYKHAARTLSYSVSAFYYDYKNLQVSSNLTANGRLQTLITNAANSRIYGVDGQAQYRPFDGFEINVAAAYTNPKFKDYVGSPAVRQCLDPTCGPSFGTFENTSLDASGFQMQRAPKFTATLGLHYQFDLGGGRMSLASNVYYTSKVYFDSSNQFSQGDYATLGLRAEWTDPSDRYTVAVYGDNVTSTHYLTSVLPHTVGVGAYWAAPATVGASFRAKF